MDTMMNNINQTITIIHAPEVNLTDDETASEALLKFYRALGWNGDDYLDPCKVRTTKDIYNNLYDVMFDRCPDPIGVGMLMVNSGPGVDDCIPTGKVYLLEGWITPAQAKGGEVVDGA